MSDNRPFSSYTVGVDFGTLSGRAVVVRVSDGAELGSAVYAYPDAVIDSRLPGSGWQLPADWALQNPRDWRAVLQLEFTPPLVDATTSLVNDLISVAGKDAVGVSSVDPNAFIFPK